MKSGINVGTGLRRKSCVQQILATNESNEWGLLRCNVFKASRKHLCSRGHFSQIPGPTDWGPGCPGYPLDKYRARQRKEDVCDCL